MLKTAGDVVKECPCTTGRIVVAGCVGSERSFAVGRVTVPGAELKRLKSSSRVALASGVASERYPTNRRVSERVVLL